MKIRVWNRNYHVAEKTKDYFHILRNSQKLVETSNRVKVAFLVYISFACNQLFKKRKIEEKREHDYRILSTLKQITYSLLVQMLYFTFMF